MLDGQQTMSFNAGDRGRTCNLWLRRPLLYPLSYTSLREQPDALIH